MYIHVFEADILFQQAIVCYLSNDILFVLIELRGKSAAPASLHFERFVVQQSNGDRFGLCAALKLVSAYDVVKELL